MVIIKMMLVALIMTIIIELLGAFIIGVRNKKDFVNVFLVNLLTNPLVTSISFFINIRYGLVSKKIAMIFLELFAFMTEGFIYKKVLEYKKMNGYVVSLILNILSYSLGIVLNVIIWK